MTNIYKKLLIVFFALLMTACGGGGSSGGGGDVPRLIGDVSGVWSATETSKNHNCTLDPDLKKYTLTVKQNGSALTIIDDEGNSYSSTLNGANFSWSGNYLDDAPDGTAGRTSLNPMSASVDASCNSLSGTANWSWTATDGSGYSCSGTTNFTATRNSAAGCGDTVDDGTTPDDGTIPDAGDTQAPTVPVLSASVVSSSQINLSWSAATDDVAVYGYDVYRDGGFLKFVSGTSTASSGLLENTSYCYTVLAKDAAGNKSAQSTQRCVTTDSVVSVDTQAPTVPANVVATAVSSGQINLSWSASSDNLAVSGYNIFRNGSYIKTVTTGTSTSDNNLIASTNYCYTVNAYDAAGNASVQSVQVCEFTQLPAVTVPAAPSNVTASNITYNSAKITWTDNSTNETGFEIGTCSGLVGSTGTYTFCSSGFTPVVTTALNTYTLTNLQASTQYRYYVRAVNTAGVSGNRQVNFVTADATPVVTTTTFYAAADNMIMVSSSNSGIANTSFNTSENGVGCNWSYSSFTGISLYVCSASLIYFDIDSIQGRTINRATLSLSVDIMPVSFTQYKIWAVYNNWFSGVTWNNMPQVQTASGSVFSQPTSSTQPLTIDVTNTVANWVDGSWVNYGFMLEDNNYTTPYSNTFRATSFCSLESCGGGSAYYPQLIIEYE